MSRPLPIAVAVSCAILASCANIRFEYGPYAIRDLEVVYSSQEDVTFLSWRLRHDAKLDLVEFELLVDGDYVEVDLAASPFAAEPWACGEDWCFQYQLLGEYVPEADQSPLRSVHRDEGIFMGPAPRVRRIQRSFDTDPIALGHNDAIDPRRFDWFERNEVPLRRAWQWQFSHREGACLDPVPDAWLPAADPIAVDRAWTGVGGEFGLCFHLRPVRADGDAVWATDMLVPSAETAFETQRYVPARVNAPVVWGMLLDLEIPDPTRCTQVKGVLIDLFEAQIGARGDGQKLGIYTPTDAETGEALTGCDQATTRDYPLEQMLRDAQTARQALEPDSTRVLWVFVNNIELPPSERIQRQLELFGLALLYGEAADGGVIPGVFGEDLPAVPEEDEDLVALGTAAFTWALGSNVFMNLFPWDRATPWRPVEDETLHADIRAGARATLPFATMRHEPSTEIEITSPRQVRLRPEYFRICDATPFAVTALGIEPGQAIYPPNGAVPWPEFDDYNPYYLVDIPPQILVPRTEYARRNEQVVVEVCTAFCGGPFRNRGGQDHDSWMLGSRCQWNL